MKHDPSTFDGLTLYTDGSHHKEDHHNPEKCGWGMVTWHARQKQHHGEICGPVHRLHQNPQVLMLSNNTAEIVALWHAAQYLLRYNIIGHVTLVYDSVYAANVVRQRWRARSHLRLMRDTEDVFVQVEKNVVLDWKWVRGHNTDVGNVIADELANRGAQGTSLVY